MASPDPLLRLLDVLQPSLAMYLADSGIWSYPGAEDLKLALADLVADHRSLVERAGVAADGRGLLAPSPVYPIHFTGCHDVDMISLVPRVIDGLRRQLERLDGILAATDQDGEAHDLVREAKESSLAHLDALEQVLSVERSRQRGQSPGAASGAAS
jgi:hypothetical protein